MKNLLQVYAEYYHSLGFNVICSSHIPNSVNRFEANIMKAPNHIFQHLFNTRQHLNELENYDWKNATGVGVVLGFEGLMAIDIDGVRSPKILSEVCSSLGLPQNYSWIFKSGSLCGYHILLNTNLPASFDEDHPLEREWTNEFGTRYFVSNNSGFNLPKPFPSAKTNAYYPNSLYRYDFIKLEFKWHGNIILPPSIHPSGNKYEVINDFYHKPKFIDLSRIEELSDNFCSLQCMESEHSRHDILVSYRVAHEDENDIIGNHTPSMIVHLDVINVSEPNNNDKNSNIIQLSYYVLDSLGNVVRRKLFNFYGGLKEPDYSIKYTIKTDRIDAIISFKTDIRNIIFREFSFIQYIIFFDKFTYELFDTEFEFSKSYHSNSDSLWTEKSIILLCDINIDNSKNRGCSINEFYEDVFEEKAMKFSIALDLNLLYLVFLKKAKQLNDSIKKWCERESVKPSCFKIK